MIFFIEMISMGNEYGQAKNASIKHYNPFDTYDVEKGDFPMMTGQ